MSERQRSLRLAHLPRVNARGLHHPECECPRCDEGHRTSPEKWQAAIDADARLEAKKREKETEAERAREKQAAADRALGETARLLREQDAARTFARTDPRTRRFHELRQGGASIMDALAIVDAEFSPETPPPKEKAP